MNTPIYSDIAEAFASVSARSPEISMRPVTDEECQFYWEHGWVHLPQIISETDAERVLADAKRITEISDSVKSVTSRTIWANPSLQSDLMADLALGHQTGLNAARLMSDPAIGPRQARISMDAVQVKEPAEIGGERTPWHQDSPEFPLDRAGQMVFWLALVPMVPEIGTMRFVERSHRLGPLGRFLNSDGPDICDYYPGVGGTEISPPLTLRPGDATAHHSLTVHSAPQNTTDRRRWVFSSGYFPADCLFTGATKGRFDKLGLTVNEILDHPELPIVG